MKTTVHCPGCGEKVEVSVVIDKVTMTSRLTAGYTETPVLEVAFDERWVAHTCQEMTS